MRTVEEHQAAVSALLPPLPEESVPLAAAHGRVLARDVVAAVALPGFDNSAMDGYAARWAEVGGAAERPVRLPVAEDIPAGRSDVVPLAPGTVHRIMTGAPLPPGADVVVPVELTDGGTDTGGDPRLPRRRHPSAAGRARTSPPGTSRCRPARRWAPPSSAWRPRSASPSCPCAAVRGCWSSRPAASWWRPGEPLAPGPDLRVQLAAARRRRRGGRRGCRAGCTSSPTTSTSSSPPCAPSSRRPTC